VFLLMYVPMGVEERLELRERIVRFRRKLGL
jgi:hypothetical protein